MASGRNSAFQPTVMKNRELLLSVSEQEALAQLRTIRGQVLNHVGHADQGRYKAILVEKESYLLELSRYVVLNPVRAGRVKDVVRWPWSSLGSDRNGLL